WMVTRPESGFSKVARIRTHVVFPAPLGPSNPSTVPSATDRSSPSSAWTLLYSLARRSTSMAAVTGLTLRSACDTLRTVFTGRRRGRHGAVPGSAGVLRDHLGVLEITVAVELPEGEPGQLVQPHVDQHVLGVRHRHVLPDAVGRPVHRRDALPA